MLSQETVKTNPTEEQKISLTLEEFLDWYPDGYEGRFELHDGEIVKMQPTGTHEKSGRFSGIQNINLH